MVTILLVILAVIFIAALLFGAILWAAVELMWPILAIIGGYYIIKWLKTEEKKKIGGA